jgi:hypothetical protein
MLSSRAEYEHFIYTIVDTYAVVEKSTLHFFTTSATAGSLKGKLWFQNGFELKVAEVIDFAAGEILEYNYTLYKGGEKVRWYDPQPHPEDSNLAETYPHHLHELPDIKVNRKPAQDISFDSPNLPTLIEQIAALSPLVDETNHLAS